MIDLDDVPHDDVLAGLRIAADGDAMRGLLTPHFNGGVELLHVKVGRLAYKPGRNARIAYRLKLLDRDRVQVHVLHGRLETPAEAAHLHKKMRKRDWAAPNYGPPLLHFEELGLVLWGFPNDPKLPGIDAIAQNRAATTLASQVPALAGLTRCDSTIVKYVPGKRLVMKHRIVLGSSRRIVFTKTWAHDRGAAIHAVMHDLWRHSQDDPAAFVCPEPLAFLPDSNTLVLAALPGTAALGTLQGGEAERAMTQAGHGLARLHTGPAQGLDAWTEAHEFENFLGATAMLERHEPDWAPAIARLRASAERSRLRVEAVPPVPIHTAFRFSQLLDFRGRLAVVDFDGFRAGHPMCDAGSFVAHLLYLVAKDELAEDAARRAIADFVAAYRQAAPGGAPPAALAWYTAVILVAKHAQKCVKRMKSEGDVKVERLLDRAARLLDSPERLG